MLQTVRSQLELYMVQHKSVYPDLSKGWGQLTNETDVNGRIVFNNQTVRHAYGPYLRHAPRNPFTGSTKVVTRKQDIGPDSGWFYVQKTGTINLIVPQFVAQELQFSSDDVVVY